MKVLWFGSTDNPQYEAVMRGIRIHWPDALVAATRNLAQAGSYRYFDEFDLVLVFMGADVSAALKFIQAIHRFSDVPLLAVAGQVVGPKERALALEAGADTVIAQPWDAREVAGKVFALRRRMSWSLVRKLDSLGILDPGNPSARLRNNTRLPNTCNTI